MKATVFTEKCISLQNNERNFHVHYSSPWNVVTFFATHSRMVVEILTAVFAIENISTGIYVLSDVLDGSTETPKLEHSFRSPI